MSHYRDTLWVALSAALNGDAGSWLQERRSAGLSWRDIEAECAAVGVPVSHEWLRSQAKARDLDRKVA